MEDISPNTTTRREKIIEVDVDTGERRVTFAEVALHSINNVDLPPTPADAVAAIADADADAASGPQASNNRHNPRLHERLYALVANGKGGLLAEKKESNNDESSDQSFLSIRSATCVLINFISVGYILNPSAFAQGGLLLGPICLAFVSLQSMITGIYVLEACARAETLKVSVTASRHAAKLGEKMIRELLMEEDTSITNIVGKEDDDDEPIMVPTPSRKRYMPQEHEFIVHERTFELSELCRIFLGRWARNFFTFTTAGDLYGITWTFAAVFGSSLSEHIKIGTEWDYQLYILMFMLITVPISCSRFVVQVPLQLVFLFARTLMVVLMLGTLAVAYATNESHFASQLRPARETPLASFSSIVTVLQLCVFSTAFQFSVPGLTAETGYKHGMSTIITRAVFYIYVTNLILSLTMAIYFGSATEESSNLNWIHYHGGSWDGEGEFERAWWATLISSYIVLFAALDGLAVYPLIAISLGDILMGAFYEDQVHLMQEKWKIRICFRLLASIPQAVGSLFLKDLGVIANYAGIFTLLSYTVCPSLLAIKSKRLVEREDLPAETNYQTCFSSEVVAWSLIGISLCLVVGVIAEAVAGR